MPYFRNKGRRSSDIFGRIAAAAAALLTAVCLSSCQMTEIPEREVVHETEVPPAMLFLGDSIAAGYGLDGYAPDDYYHCPSYSNILSERYSGELEGQCGHTMVNKAVSGYTSQDFIDQLRSGELDADLAGSDAVIVSIGGNDLLDIMLGLFQSLGVDDKGSFNSDGLDLFSAASLFFSMDKDVDAALEQFDKNMDIISGELLSRTEGQVYFQTLYNPLEYYTEFSMVTDFSAEKIGRLNSIIKSHSSGSYKVIDVAAKFSGKAEELTNISDLDIHPNAEGHKVIAETVDRAFRETGFTYTTTELGEKRLTDVGRSVIIGSSAVAVALLISITAAVCIIVRRKKKSKD